jgi:hypothetical protein
MPNVVNIASITNYVNYSLIDQIYLSKFDDEPNNHCEDREHVGDGDADVHRGLDQTCCLWVAADCLKRLRLTKIPRPIPGPITPSPTTIAIESVFATSISI